jgi:hypothetical protein
MDIVLKNARDAIRFAREYPDELLILIEIITRLGVGAIEQVDQRDLAHLRDCRRTYTNCKVPVCRRLRLWYYDNLLEVERQREYWKSKGLALAEREGFIERKEEGDS